MQYTTVYQQETHGTYGPFGIKIDVSAGRELDSEDSARLSSEIEKIIAAIRERSIKLNPKFMEESTREKANILELFDCPIYVEEILNGYCSEWCCKHKPWFIVTTKVGRIKIGWRKSVMVIDYSDTVVKKDASDLFPNEDVTKMDRMMHAWSYEKAKEYIDKILLS